MEPNWHQPHKHTESIDIPESLFIQYPCSNDQCSNCSKSNMLPGGHSLQQTRHKSKMYFNTSLSPKCELCRIHGTLDFLQFSFSKSIPSGIFLIIKITSDWPMIALSTDQICKYKSHHPRYRSHTNSKSSVSPVFLFQRSFWASLLAKKGF